MLCCRHERKLARCEGRPALISLSLPTSLLRRATPTDPKHLLSLLLGFGSFHGKVITAAAAAMMTTLTYSVKPWGVGFRHTMGLLLVLGRKERRGGDVKKNLREQPNISFDVFFFQVSKIKLNILHERAHADVTQNEAKPRRDGPPPFLTAHQLLLPSPTVPLVLVFCEENYS